MGTMFNAMVVLLSTAWKAMKEKENQDFTNGDYSNEAYKKRQFIRLITCYLALARGSTMHEHQVS